MTNNPTTPNREVARDFLRRRQQCYQHTFHADNQMAREVLLDLMQFCRAAPGQSTFDTNQKVQDVLTGRNEVFRRIADHMGLSLDDLYTLYGGR